MAIRSESGVRICLSLICLLYAGVVFRTAWLAEDAFITFRTVDNFINGYGLTWNIGERVQAYTHPLWMFLVSACYFATREISLTTMFLSLAVSSTAVWIFVRNVADSAWAALGVLVIIASRAFIDYSTSGLENPLTHLLLALLESDDNRTSSSCSMDSILAPLLRFPLSQYGVRQIGYWGWCS